jgi:copper transport protein
VNDVDTGWAEAAWDLATAANNALLYAAVLLALGSLLLLAWMPWPEDLRATVVRQGRVAALLALPAFGLALALAGGEATGGAGGWPFTGLAWDIALHSSLGRAAGFGAVAILLGYWALGIRAVGAPASLARQVAAALFVASLATTGHAAAAPPQGVMAASVAAHVIAAGFWGAALWPLAAAAARLEPPASGELLERFASRAVGVLIMLIVSGLVLMLVQVDRPRYLLTTAYGQRLSLKLAAVAGLLWLAARNNLSFTPALQRGDARAAAPFRRSALTELALMGGVVLLAASLTVVEPPRSLMPVPVPAH